MPVDFMGQTFGGYDYFPPSAYDETEEERRRRLALEQEANTPVKQTITTDPRTGVQKVKIEGSALNLSAANPATPTVTGPVRPEDIYNRQIQVESGGRQFAPTGQVLTSPKGAMGIGQIMPATAAQPGYGVPTIFDLAEQRGIAVPSRDIAGAQQLLGNEQLNREFGQQYSTAMQNRFGTQGGVAAYNAGPGRVGQNLQANAGQLNTAELPQETQDYIQKVLGKMPGYVPGQPTGQAAMAQSPGQQPIIDDQGQIIGYETPQQMIAGAQTNAPVAPVAPGAPSQMVQTQAPAVQAGPMGEQMGPGTQFMTPTGWADRLNTAKQDDRMLANLAYDPNLPQYVREEASEVLFNKMKNIKLEAEAKQKWQSAMTKGDLSEINREMKRDTQEGSWLKYLFYGFVDPNMARNERLKLFPEEGAVYQNIITPEGKAGEILISRNGQALRGRFSDGTSMNQDELLRFGATAGPASKVETGLVDNLTGVGGYTRKVVNGNIIVTDSAGRIVSDPNIVSNLRNVGVEGTLAERLENTKVKNAYATLAKDIPNPTPEQTYQYLKRAGVSDTRIQQELAGTGYKPGIPTTPTTPGGAVATTAPTTPTPGATPVKTAPEPFDRKNPPVAKPGETKASLDARIAEWKKKTERLDKQEEALPAIEATAKDTLATMDDILTHPGFSDVIGMPNILTGIYSPPGTDARDFKAKYKKLEGEQFLSAYDKLRGAGAITEVEGRVAKQAMAALTDPYISEAEFRRNAKIYTDTIKRGINRQRAQLGLAPEYPDVPEVTATGEGKPSAGAPMSPQDKAREEIRRRQQEKK